MAHSVLWLCSAIAERRPLTLVVDDAQWADRASLEVLAYLARRIEDLPLLIVIAARADDPDAASDLLSLLGSVRSATVLHPQPLTARGAAKLIRRSRRRAAAVCRDCHRAVGGNPWLLGELGRQIAAHGPEAVDDSGTTPPQVTAVARNVVRRRMAELSPRDRARRRGARGDRRRRAAARGRRRGRRTGRGARRGPRRAGRRRAARAGGERFAHGLIAVAIAEELPRTERERLHREAARALMERRRPGVVAWHLLECGPQADPDVSELLLAPPRRPREVRRAARGGRLPRARAAGARPGRRPRRMLARLGTVAFDAGLPDSRRRLREALREVATAVPVDVLTRLAALNVVDAGDAGSRRSSSRNWPASTIPTCASRSRPPRWTRC